VFTELRKKKTCQRKFIEDKRDLNQSTTHRNSHKSGVLTLKRTTVFKTVCPAGNWKYRYYSNNTKHTHNKMH